MCSWKRKRARFILKEIRRLKIGLRSSLGKTLPSQASNRWKESAWGIFCSQKATTNKSCCFSGSSTELLLNHEWVPNKWKHLQEQHRGPAWPIYHSRPTLHHFLRCISAPSIINQGQAWSIKIKKFIKSFFLTRTPLSLSEAFRSLMKTFSLDSLVPVS